MRHNSHYMHQIKEWFLFQRLPYLDVGRGAGKSGGICIMQHIFKNCKNEILFWLLVQFLQQWIHNLIIFCCSICQSQDLLSEYTEQPKFLFSLINRIIYVRKYLWRSYNPSPFPVQDQIKLDSSDLCLSLKWSFYIFFLWDHFLHFSSILLFSNVLNSSKYSIPDSPYQCHILLCLSLLLPFVRCSEVFSVFFDCCYPLDTHCPRAVPKDIQAELTGHSELSAESDAAMHCALHCSLQQWPWSAEEDLLLISQTPNNLQSGWIWIISCHL